MRIHSHNVHEVMHTGMHVCLHKRALEGVQVGGREEEGESVCGRAGTRAGDPASKEGVCAAGSHGGRSVVGQVADPNRYCALPTQGGESAASVKSGRQECEACEAR